MLENKIIYIDKTEIIYELIKQTAQGAIIVNAPRRTGKTLFLTTIRAMYTQNLNWWKIYGPDLWITNKQPKFFPEKPFPIIFFKFYQCPNDKDFKRIIVQVFNSVIEEEKLPINEIMNEIDWGDLVFTKFSKIIQSLRNIYQKKVILLIDALN